MRELVANPSLIESHLEGMTVQQAIEAGKLYVIDLRYLADIECKNGKTLPGPTCLLFVRHSGDLVPVAIQLMPNAGADNPIFTPSDHEYTWLAAKMWFNLADCSHHQSVSHLGMTHLLMESVAVVTNRQLSRSHPLYRLLAPHFLFIMNINSLAVEALVSVGGWVDTAMNIGRTGMFNIIKANWKDWKLETNGNLPANLKIRGVEEIPNYFYRDDALLLWNAINKYVAEVVNQVYDTKDKFNEDYELHNWLKKLEEDAEIGMPKEVSREKLIEILTVFIFTSSVQHAAVNFGQYDEYAFPPNYPADLHGSRPTSRDELTEDSIVKIVPDKKQTLDILQITHVLSQRGTNELGNFEIGYGYDPIASKALDSFKEELKSIQSTIEEKNKTRKRKYDILQPKDVPNAISI
ncbi:ALOX5 [Bugula neritina]|uniref:ALOX5 n=1 Tax=Bugula neritina TaxID=10212 RepID=A0A7J7JVE1_BUGNE|nr:ALOX5 [Bugula neritina]